MDEKNSFFAIDFETANQNRCSICEIGLYFFADGEVKKIVDKRINPEEEFAPVNISIHGIRPHDVINEPTYPQIHERFVQGIGNKVIVSWTNFDKQCFEKIIKKYRLCANGIRWLDASMVVRQIWPEYKSGYKLRNISKALGIEYQYHQGAEDARACGLVLHKALEESGTSIEYWFDKFGETVNHRPKTQSANMESQNTKENKSEKFAVGITIGLLVVFFICVCFGLMYIISL